jgi:peptidoglycan/xylan/chitin deacetylase (PgdA/CDA1 family)
MPQHKIVVFTGSFSYSVRKGIAEIERTVPGLEWLVVVHSARREVRALVRSQWRNLRRNGWRWIPVQATEVLHRLRASDEPALSRSVPGEQFTSAALRTRSNFHFVTTPSLDSAATQRVVREFGPDLGLSLAAPILRPPLFGLPRLGTLNLHKGKLPDYRGMPPAFWELWNDERTVGCTVHWVEEGLDTGPIVAETAVSRESFATLRGLQLKLDEVGVELMRAAVGAVLAGSASMTPQRAGGHTYRKPTLAQTAALYRRLCPPEPFGAKRAAKNVVHASALTLARAGLRGLLAPRVTVILYHRVSDAARDNLTVGVEQFDRQMALIRRHCEVLSIEEVIALRNVPRTSKPLVSVTFDDGYLDNFENAVPILLRHRIPAAFFVSTGIVDTGGRFPHDVRRGNPPIPVMSWAQLREMRELGFTIGSHSVTHIDCAAEPEATVRRELADSLEDIRREVGAASVLFAYPYGGRDNMTPERLALVKEAGYAGCLSAYGGTNRVAVDPFDVKRRGIDFKFSDRAFLFECLGI